MKKQLVAGIGSVCAVMCMSTVGLAQDIEGELVEDGSPWVERHAPESGLLEIGLYGGLLSPSDRLELFAQDFDRPDEGFKAFDSNALDLGLRLGYYPLSALGIEVEGGAMPTSVEDGADATIYTARAHALAQIPYWRVTPFAVVGGGILGVSSGDDAVRDDIDPLFHFGAGLKFNINEWSQLRVDIRNNMSPKAKSEGPTSSLEVLAGFSMVFGSTEESAPIASTEPIVEPAKPVEEPKAPVDTDKDGIFDDVDKCIDAPETVNNIQDEDGCPEGDTDKDGVLDPVDACPNEAGPREDGCPHPDTDKDGIIDPNDKCVDEAETRNGFQDEDGCPDTLPEKVKEFTGTIKGINFASGSNAITASSNATLTRTAAVLTEFPELRVLIIGHTDDRGSKADNTELSQKRAEAVKAWLVAKGIDASRLQTRGLGPDQPLVSNDTQANRAKNRRIEFKIIN